MNNLNNSGNTCNTMDILDKDFFHLGRELRRDNAEMQESQNTEIEKSKVEIEKLKKGLRIKKMQWLKRGI